MRTMLASLARNRPLRRIVLLLLLVLAYQAWLGFQAIGKVADGVGAEPDSRGRFGVDVVLEFRPERYHILELQKHGRIRGADQNVVHLRSVSPAGVDALAREYWISEVVPPNRAGM